MHIYFHLKATKWYHKNFKTKIINIAGLKVGEDQISDGGSNNGGGSNNKNNKPDLDESLMNTELKMWEIDDLYGKFNEAGVTDNIIWDLDDEMLEDCKLTRIEKLRYQKAAASRRKYVQECREKWKTVD